MEITLPDQCDQGVPRSQSKTAAGPKTHRMKPCSRSWASSSLSRRNLSKRRSPRTTGCGRQSYREPPARRQRPRRGHRCPPRRFRHGPGHLLPLLKVVKFFDQQRLHPAPGPRRHPGGNFPAKPISPFRAGNSRERSWWRGSGTGRRRAGSPGRRPPAGAVQRRPGEIRGMIGGEGEGHGGKPPEVASSQ